MAPWRPGVGPRPEEPVLDVDSATLIRHGADLFDHGAWWEAHCVWELQWRAEPLGSARRQALQALIQTAAYHLKDAPELARAGARLKQRALERLDSAVGAGLTQLEGLDLVTLRSELAEHVLGGPPLKL